MNQAIDKRVVARITDFVDRINKHPHFTYSPIIAFQFISLDSIQQGRMVWWNYLNAEIRQRYEEVIDEFTDRSNSQIAVKNTLINWEYPQEPYWYTEFSKEQISSKLGNSFTSVSSFYDESGIEREEAVESEKQILLEKWKKILAEKFNNRGSTMWVSIPHREFQGDIVYSSIFTLFNGPIDESKSRGEIFRIFRDFIIDYILDLYRKPIEDDLHIVTSEIERALPTKSHKSFIPNYSYNGEVIQEKIKSLTNSYCDSSSLGRLLKTRQDAELRLKRTIAVDGTTFESPKDYPKVYKRFQGIKNRDDYYLHLYGRFLLLAYTIVFEHTIEMAYKTLTNDIKSFTYIQSLFGIKGFRADKRGTDGEKAFRSDRDTIYKNISAQESSFLIQLAIEHKKAWIEVDIINAREDQTSL